MVTVRRTNVITHSGVQGMKWGYNAGTRNGKRTAKELNDLKNKQAELSKTNKYVNVSKDIEKDYLQADHMLRYLGITLDAHSNDEAVVKSIAIYKHMAETKDNYKNQYDWLKAFTTRLSGIGYDMKAVDQMIEKNKTSFESLKSGGGADAEVKKEVETNADFAEAYKKNKVKREAVKKHDKKVSKSSKTDVDKNKTAKHSENQNGDEIYHHGILGMKWGVRRYQNKDGSLTDAGRKHYGYKEVSKMSDDELRSALNRKRLENRYKDLKVGGPKRSNRFTEESLRTASKVNFAISRKANKVGVSSALNTSAKVVSNANQIADKVNASKNRKMKDKIDLSKMDTKTLQKEVNRMQMEKDLIELERNSNSGRKLTIDTLQTIGLISMTAVSAAPYIKKAAPYAAKAIVALSTLPLKKANYIRI